MSHFLVTATEQEIFDAAYMGLKSQGFKQSSNDEECFYDDGKGHHCAIGWACALSKSKMPKEGDSVIDNNFYEQIGVRKIPEDRRGFLLDLQCIHDNADSSEDMKHELEEFAKEYNLTVPSFDVSRLKLETV